MPLMTSLTCPKPKVDIGRSRVDAHFRDSKGRIRGVTVAHPENAVLKVGVDKTGRRYWRPGLQP